MHAPQKNSQVMQGNVGMYISSFQYLRGVNSSRYLSKEMSGGMTHAIFSVFLHKIIFNLFSIWAA